MILPGSENPSAGSDYRYQRRQWPAIGETAAQAAGAVWKNHCQGFCM